LIGDGKHADGDAKEQALTTRSKQLVLLLWLCFLARGCFYSALLPIWEGYDEPSHFAFIQHVTVHRDLPVATTPVSREVQESLHSLPLSWEQRLHALAPPIYTQDSYWQLSAADRRALQEQTRAIPPAWGAQLGTGPALYEAQQAPLYYWMMSVPLRWAWAWPLAGRVMLIRMLSVLLASLVIPIAYAAARSFFASDGLALGTAAVITCMPELMIDISRAGNDSLAIVVYSLLTLLLLLAVQPGRSNLFVAAGAVLGVGLLSKAYFLPAVPAFVLVAVYSFWRLPVERRRILLNSAVGMVLALLISFGWYWRNRVLTGTWSGEQDDAIAAHASLPHLATAIRHVNWAGGVTSVLVSHVWFGGWSFLKLPKLIYVVFALGMAAALFGLVKVVRKPEFRSARLIVLLALYALFWAGLLYDVVVVYMARGVSASCGWYMYAVIVPEILLVTYGLLAIAPRRWGWAVLPTMATMFAAIDIYGVHALLVPYYSGLIAHVPGSDMVHPARLAQLVSAGPHLLLDRLAANKPDSLTPEVFALLFVAYYLATAATVAVSYAAARATLADAEFPSQR
jgi:Dolichyl-phosphate-mannose-protein mannosyltransferase